MKKTDIQKSMMEYALEYARRGLAVFPVHTVIDGKCSCEKDCHSPGKHPLTIKGFRNATTDESTIQNWWGRWPDANIGIATGRESGVIVLDIDKEKGGFESLKVLKGKYGKLFQKVKVKTGGGGAHIYYKYPVGHDDIIRNASGLSKLGGIDVRADGGYAVAPPSQHISGLCYEWKAGRSIFEAEMAEAPAWLLELLKKPNEPIDSLADDASNDYRSNAGEWVIGALRSLKEGNRNDTFARLTGKLRRGGLSANEISELLEPHALKASFPIRELVEEVHGICTRYPETSIPNRPYISKGSIEVFEPVRIADFPEPPPQEWIVEKLIPRGHTTVLYADGAQGKTFLTTVLASCLALGLPFIELKTQQTNVLYLDWEMSRADYLRRAYPVARGLGFDNLVDGIFYAEPHAGLLDILENVYQYTQEHDIEIIMVDSLGLAAGIDPESANQVVPFFRALKSFGVTCLLLDHQAKLQQGQAYGQKTIFGSAYKFNLSRSVFQLQKTCAQKEFMDLVLRPTKNNLGQLEQPIAMRLIFGPDSKIIKLVPREADPSELMETTSVKDHIMVELGVSGPATAEEIAESIEKSRSTVTNALGELKNAGLIEVCGKGGKMNNAPIYRLKEPLKGNV